MELIYFDVTHIDNHMAPKEFNNFILTNDYYEFNKYFDSDFKKYTDEEINRKNHKKFAITFKGSNFYQWLTDIGFEEVSEDDIIASPIFMLTASKLMSDKYRIDKIMTTLVDHYEYEKFKCLINNNNILYIDKIKFSYTDINYHLKIKFDNNNFELYANSIYYQDKYDQIKKAISEINNQYKDFKINQIIKEVKKEYNNTVISEEIIY